MCDRNIDVTGGKIQVCKSTPNIFTLSSFPPSFLSGQRSSHRHVHVSKCGIPQHLPHHLRQTRNMGGASRDKPARWGRSLLRHVRDTVGHAQQPTDNYTIMIILVFSFETSDGQYMAVGAIEPQFYR